MKQHILPQQLIESNPGMAFSLRALLTKLLDLAQLTKPEIMLLVVLTGATAVVMEGSLLHEPLKFAAIILGLELAGGSANALNQYFEREIDARMSRTRRKRPLPLGKVTPNEALAFALTIGISSVAIFGLMFNWLAAGLAAATILFYSLYYTLWLKPRTHLNIVIGGAAGAMAPIIAWAAATGEVSVTAWLLFGIIFLWTPPHFWSLALCLKRDYETVRMPMLPVVKGDDETRKQIFIYTLWLLALSLGLMWLGAGGFYLVSALGLGGTFAWKAFRIWRQGEAAEAWGLFKYSIVYLMSLFVALMVDKAIG
ncbi:MAG TPA: heme o synthase [bacterium]|jgi:protoheme IX farnesyltransferase